MEAVNQELTALLYRRQYNSRIRESRAAVCRQYGELSALLGTAAAELSRELIPDPAGNQKLRRHLALLGLEMETAVYRDEYGRLRAELKGEDARLWTHRRSWPPYRICWVCLPGRRRGRRA